ncbi:hypothetical protein [Streptomyces albicerus]|uniref:hypothetical protein n=1 Tax=Streptomyces albicerus TaxID=2569859 RepID=UPI001788C390|nr:hypothetical protein [Streptomyces albicerus]
MSQEVVATTFSMSLPPLGPVPAPKLPDQPAYRQVMALFAAADTPLRARRVCEATDMKIAPNNINNTRLNLKRLTERGTLVKTSRASSPSRGGRPGKAAAGPMSLPKW